MGWQEAPPGGHGAPARLRIRTTLSRYTKSGIELLLAYDRHPPTP